MLSLLLLSSAIARAAGDGPKVEAVDGKPLLVCVYAAGGEAWAAGEHGVVYHRSAKGVWDAQKTGTPVNLRGIGGAGAKEVWAAGLGGGLVHWNGTSWKAEMSDDDRIDGILLVTPKLGLSFGEHIWTYAGKKWDATAASADFDGLRAAVSIGTAAKPRFLVVGEKGQAILVEGVGHSATATAETTGTTDELAGVAACPGGDTIAVGAVAMKRTAKGAWSALSAPPVAVRGAVIRCAGAKAKTVAAVAGGDLLVLDVAKNTWSRTTIASGATLSAITAFGAGYIAVGKDGAVVTGRF